MSRHWHPVIVLSQKEGKELDCRPTPKEDIYRKESLELGDTTEASREIGVPDCDTQSQKSEKTVEPQYSDISDSENDSDLKEISSDEEEDDDGGEATTSQSSDDDEHCSYHKEKFDIFDSDQEDDHTYSVVKRRKIKQEWIALSDAETNLN